MESPELDYQNDPDSPTRGELKAFPVLRACGLFSFLRIY